MNVKVECEAYGAVVDTYNTGKGYAFVTYGCKEDAELATDKLNGATIFGQVIKVSSFMSAEYSQHC